MRQHQEFHRALLAPPFQCPGQPNFLTGVNFLAEAAYGFESVTPAEYKTPRRVLRPCCKAIPQTRHEFAATMFDIDVDTSAAANRTLVQRIKRSAQQLCGHQGIGIHKNKAVSTCRRSTRVTRPRYLIFGFEHQLKRSSRRAGAPWRYAPCRRSSYCPRR